MSAVSTIPWEVKHHAHWQRLISLLTCVYFLRGDAQFGPADVPCRSRSWRCESLAAPPGKKTGSKLAFLNGGGAPIPREGTCLGALQVPAPLWYFTELQHAGPRGAAPAQWVHTVKVTWMNGWMEPFTAARGWRMPVTEKEPRNHQDFSSTSTNRLQRARKVSVEFIPIFVSKNCTNNLDGAN